jgi:hypothetical protein
MAAKLNLTKEQLQLVQYNNVIVKNKAKFKKGASMTRDEFVKLFNVQDIVNTGEYAEVHRSNLRLVGVQMQVNRLMRENGLYIASSDYYSNFEVLKKEKTKKTVLRYSAEVDINSACTNRLETKLTERVKANTWGTYNNVSVGRISNMHSSNTTRRHMNTIKRVKTI